MDHFWVGYLVAIGTYFVIGAAFGVYTVVSNLAHFHGGGFQWKRMAGHIGAVTIAWPMVLLG